MGRHHPRPLRNLDIVCDLCNKGVRDRPAMFQHSQTAHPTVPLEDVSWRLLDSRETTALVAADGDPTHTKDTP